MPFHLIKFAAIGSTNDQKCVCLFGQLYLQLANFNYIWAPLQIFGQLYKYCKYLFHSIGPKNNIFLGTFQVVGRKSFLRLAELMA